MQVIPAIDVLDGKTVRLAQGDFTRKTTWEDDPLTIAKRYKEDGARRIHLVNLSGAKEEKIDSSFLQLIRSIITETGLSVQTGGGIRSLKDIQALLEAGAGQIVIGTLIFTNPDVISNAIALFGNNRFVAALDVWRDEIKIQGWREGTNVKLNDALQLIVQMGIGTALITNIECDGMESGPNLRLYKNVQSKFPSVRVIASGGIRGGGDIRALRSQGCDAAVVGKSLLNGATSFPELLKAASSDLAVRIIPCLDVKNGRVVKGTSFQNLRDAGDPVELAKRYCYEGADELVFLDITATSDDREMVYKLASRVADNVNIPFTMGGGIRSVKDARRLLEAGADKVSVNSAAVKRPELLSEMAEQLGSANTVCAIDAKRKDCHPEPVEGWTVLVRGGREDTGRDAIEWAKDAVYRGAGELLVTSYDRDGTGEGFDTELLRTIKELVSVPIIASGGAGSLQTFVDAVQDGKADAVLAASVFHFGTFCIRDVKEVLQKASFPIRL